MGYLISGVLVGVLVKLKKELVEIKKENNEIIKENTFYRCKIGRIINKCKQAKQVNISAMYAEVNRIQGIAEEEEK